MDVEPASLPTNVRRIVDTFLRAADVAVPGLIEGMYLIGSVALGDFRLHRSDIDFIAVTAERPAAAQLVAFERIHANLQRQWKRPCFDGTYVTWSDLASDPTRLGPGPHAHEGRLGAVDQGERNPVAWYTLAHHGIPCRGPAVETLPIWSEPAVLAAWTNDNLDRYWRVYLERGARLMSRPGLVQVTEWACEWCVLGVSRLHFTLTQGAITSKDGAGRYALDVFPARWHPVLQEALRIRNAVGGPSLYRSALARRRDVLAYGRMAIADAKGQYARRTS